ERERRARRRGPRGLAGSARARGADRRRGEGAPRRAAGGWRARRLAPQARGGRARDRRRLRGRAPAGAEGPPRRDRARAGVMSLSWGPRAVPLAPCAVYAEGEAARALVRRLLARTDEELARLRGVAAASLVLILGEDLPWVDGARYLGADPLALALLLPT